MKTVHIFCGAFLILSLASTGLHAQGAASPYPYYVMVGAFAVQKNAENFVASQQKKYPGITMKRNALRSLYYVYTESTTDRAAAFRKARQFQQGDFPDSWVYSGPLEGDLVVNKEKTGGEDINPVSGERKAGVSLGDQITVKEDTATSNANPPPDTLSYKAPNPVVDNKINQDKFYFPIRRAADHQQIDGDVTEVDVDRSRKVVTLDGNSYVNLPPPNNRSGKVLLVCDVFGYRQAQEALDYKDPEGYNRDSTGAMVIPFDLVRLQKGDVSVMYRVLFFKDAAIMQPSSEYELKSLLEMMKENPNYRIRIHGHTNGNKGGKILYPAEGGSFFSLDGAREGSGSAKKLSERRAEIVRDYLVKNGIDPSRMEIKAWGGKLPLYDKTSARAEENVRVEIEILQD